MQRHATFEVPLSATHIRSTESARRLDANAFGTGFERCSDRSLHRTTERDTTFELVSDAARKQRGVDLRVMHLDDIELDSATGELLEPGAHTLGLGATSTDDDARSTSVNVDLNFLVADPLNVNARDRTALELSVQECSDLVVLVNVGSVILVAVPARRPVGDDSETQSVWVSFLSHQASSS